MRRSLAVVIVLAAFAGCGGDGDETAGPPPAKSTTASQGTTSGPTSTTGNGGDRGSGGGGQELNRLKDPRTAVQAVLTSSDPAEACGKYVTNRYLTIAYGGRQGCIDARRIAHKLEFKDLRVDGDRATAVVVPSDGTYKGEQLIVSLVRRDRRWAVDQLDANVPVGP